MSRKAHPDEKGTESFTRSLIENGDLLSRKAHPDEKGTERAAALYYLVPDSCRVAKHIPMRRELKVI